MESKAKKLLIFLMMKWPFGWHLVKLSDFFRQFKMIQKFETKRLILWEKNLNPFKAEHPKLQ